MRRFCQMDYRNGLRPRLLLLCAAVLVTVAAPAATAVAKAPGLPRTYLPTRIDSGDPVAGGAFGWGIYSADLTGDGHQDLLVAQGQLGTKQDPTQVFIYDGVTGQLVDTITPPEDNPNNPALVNPTTNPTGY